jgi:hypothetical protein
MPAEDESEQPSQDVPVSVARRDRDAVGRPRNARARDGLGRPQPRGTEGIPPTEDMPDVPPAITLDRAQQLLDEGKPFHAHEVLEAAWKSAPLEERGLWQGLAQLAVGLTHILRENEIGAASVLARGRDNVALYATAAPHGIDAVGLVYWANTVIADLALASANQTKLCVPTTPHLR